MAKTKKQTKSQLQPEITTAQNNSISYQGKVKLQLLHGTKVISTHNYLNKGLPDLFKYISNALAGISYTTLRPCKVALFYCATETGAYMNPATFVWEDAYKNSLLTEVSPYIVYDASPVISAAGEGYATTFRFKIPASWLYKKAFNVIGLFSENNTSCAYYLCTKPKSDGVEWDTTDLTQELKDVTGNYSLIIEWTMEVSNK